MTFNCFKLLVIQNAIQMKRYVAYLLIVLGIVMIYLSYQVEGLPPAITGVGFVAIGLVFLKEK